MSLIDLRQTGICAVWPITPCDRAGGKNRFKSLAEEERWLLIGFVLFHFDSVLELPLLFLSLRLVLHVSAPPNSEQCVDNT